MLDKNIKFKVNPVITADQLWDFYVRNDICEVGFGKEIAVLPLKHSSLIVGAFEDEKLVGIARAMFDGVSADIVEFCVECECQGEELCYDNGSLVEKDKYSIGKRMGDITINELRKMGATFISVYLVQNCEEEVYKSLGFKENTGHSIYIIDERPYVVDGDDFSHP